MENLRGIFFMTVAMASFALEDLIIKILSRDIKSKYSNFILVNDTFSRIDKIVEESKINKKTFKLFTQQDGAWSANPELDAKLVRAMKSGNRMVVYGISSRGTKTTDTYSLSGFTAMKKRIDKACK